MWEKTSEPYRSVSCRVICPIEAPHLTQAGEQREPVDSRSLCRGRHPVSGRCCAVSISIFLSLFLPWSSACVPPLRENGAAEKVQSAGCPDECSKQDSGNGDGHSVERDHTVALCGFRKG